MGCTSGRTSRPRSLATLPQLDGLAGGAARFGWPRGLGGWRGGLDACGADGSGVEVVPSVSANEAHGSFSADIMFSRFSKQSKRERFSLRLGRDYARLQSVPKTSRSVAAALHNGLAGGVLAGQGSKSLGGAKGVTESALKMGRSSGSCCHCRPHRRGVVRDWPSCVASGRLGSKPS